MAFSKDVESLSTAHTDFLNAHYDLNPVVEAYLDGEIRNDFINDVISKFIRWGDLSVRQVSAVISAYKRDLERANEPDPTAPAPEGRMTVEGEVLTIKEKVGRYGAQWKLLMRLDSGSKVWGTCPASILRDVKVKDRVSITATFTRSDRDDFFGFFNRPRGSIVSKG